MTEYLECHNFLKECRTFMEKHEHFLTNCKKLSSKGDPEDVDPYFVDVIAQLYVEVKRWMEKICDEHKCIVYNSQTDEDMESDISDLDNSETNETDESDEDDETEEEEGEEEQEDEENDDEDGNYDSNTDGEESDEKIDDNDDDYEDVIDLFTSNHCCIDEIFNPFFNAMVEQKNLDIIRKIQKYDDHYEENCLRYTIWFNSHEKEECATILKEIFDQYKVEGTKFFKICPSNYIKLFAVCCRDTIDSKIGKKMIGSKFENIRNDSFPLNKKRKLFTKKEIVTKLMKYIEDKTMPQVNNYLEERTKHILSKS